MLKRTSQTRLVENLLLAVKMAKNIEISSIDDGDINKIVEKLPSHKKLITKTTNYLTSIIRIIFTQLRKPFTKTLIFHYFNPECYN